MHKFVITVAVYNAERWIERCLKSAFAQRAGSSGASARMLVIDDASTDRTFDVINSTLAEVNRQLTAGVVVKRNQTRQGALRNYREMISECADDEIIINLDGDDHLPGDGVIERLCREYDDPRVWMTYGSFAYDYESRNPNGSPMGISAQVPADRHDRTHGWSCSHLRTYYAWLFKRIRERDFMRDGRYFQAAPDLAIMYPLIEMAGPAHARFIPDVLYLYNAVNPLAEVKVAKTESDSVYEYLARQQAYPRLAEAGDWPDIRP